MTDLDKLIHQVIERRADRDLDGITLDVQADLTGELRKSLTLSPTAILYRFIRRRVRMILRHDPRQPTLPGLQNHYSTPAKGIWVALKDLGFDTAMWNLNRLDQRRKKAEAEHAALAAWIRQTFPDKVEEPAIQEALGARKEA